MKARLRKSRIFSASGCARHPSEVEAAIARLPGVQEVAVVGFASAREVEAIAAFVKADTGVSVAQIEGHCRTALTADKRPRKFVLVDDLPRNANGKIDRKALGEQYRDFFGAAGDLG